MAMENWERGPFQPPNNGTAKTETQVSLKMLWNPGLEESRELQSWAGGCAAGYTMAQRPEGWERGISPPKPTLLTFYCQTETRPLKSTTCSLPPLPSLLHAENEPPCNPAQREAFEKQPFPILGSQQQNIGVGCFSYSFGQSYYHHAAEKLPWEAVMLKPNLHIIRYAHTQGVNGAWKKEHPLQHLSSAYHHYHGLASWMKFWEHKVSPSRNPTVRGSSLTSQTRVPVLSHTGIDTGSNVNGKAPVEVNT